MGGLGKYVTRHISELYTVRIATFTIIVFIIYDIGTGCTELLFLLRFLQHFRCTDTHS